MFSPARDVNHFEHYVYIHTCTSSGENQGLGPLHGSMQVYVALPKTVYERFHMRWKRCDFIAFWLLVLSRSNITERCKLSWSSTDAQ